MNEITCPNCGSRLPAQAVFCDHCGVNLAAHTSASHPSSDASAERPSGVIRLPSHTQPARSHRAGAMQVCPTCRNELPAHARFCDHCGTALATQVQPRVAGPVARSQPPLETPPQARPGSTPTVLEGPPPTPQPPGPSPIDRTVIDPHRRAYPTGRLVLLASGTRFEFPPGHAQITVGREDPVNNIFPEVDLTPQGGEGGGVSRRHACFSLQDGQLVVEDLNSTNFTFVNRKRVLPGARVTVRHGDEVRFGRIIARYEEGG